MKTKVIELYVIAVITGVIPLLNSLRTEHNNEREKAVERIENKLKEKWETLKIESDKNYAFPFEVNSEENDLTIDYKSNINLKNLNNEQKSSFMLSKYNFEEIPIGKMVNISLKYIIDDLLNKNMSKTIIKGTCDNIPLVKDNATYKGEFGDNLSIKHYNINTDQDSIMTFHKGKKLSDNYEFALLRAYSVFHYFKENHIPINIENTEFKIQMIDEEGKRYCDFSVIFEDYFLED